MEDLLSLGYDRDFACHILSLLDRQEQLKRYLFLGKQQGCIPVTPISPQYPRQLLEKLGREAPGCLWVKGDVSLLKGPAVSLVGSRQLGQTNGDFAREVGRQAAILGYTLISGNARGADQRAQESCLAYGGKVISVVADTLWDKPVPDNMLYISLEGFDRRFSNFRALNRNRIIHAMGDKTFVAQCTLGKGGTWNGTADNLKKHWSPVFCFQDGSAAAQELIAMGAVPTDILDLAQMASLTPPENSFLP